MGFIDRATHRVYHADECTTYRIQVGNCDLCIFVLKREPRVFVGGGVTGFDSLAREADAVEIIALAERFDLETLWNVLAKRRESE